MEEHHKSQSRGKTAERAEKQQVDAAKSKQPGDPHLKVMQAALVKRLVVLLKKKPTDLTGFNSS